MRVYREERSNVKTLKKLKIFGVVVRPKNIRELANRVYAEYSQDLKKQENVSIKFILKSFDGTQYESEKMGFLSEGETLDNRRIVAIEMRYHNDSYDKWIDINLEHTISDWITRNKATVSGYDEVWTNGIVKMIEEIVSGWKKQADWPRKYKWLLLLILSIAMGLSFYLLLYSIVGLFLSTSELFKKTLPFFAVCLSSAFVLGHYMVDRIRRLYPSVEFMMGPEHSRVEGRKREKIYRVVQIIILTFLPLAISLILNLVGILRR